MSASHSKKSSPTSSPPPEKVDLSGNKIVKPNNGWTKEQEELMAEWADIAACYRWMHDKYEKKASLSNMWITVPVIILSTLTGSASFIMTSMTGDNPTAAKYAQIGIGGVSIFTGILTTLGNFFRYAQSSEANRVASIAWGKFQRQIAIELALHPIDRIDSMDFLNVCRSELDRLIEQSPQIPDKVIEEFEKEFSDRPTLKKPDIAHGIDHTKIFIDTDNRMKKLLVDATVMLKQKKKVWHDAMMPDVDKHLENRIQKEIGSFSSTLEAKLRDLEEKLSTRGIQRSSLRGSTSVRRVMMEKVDSVLHGTNQISPGQLISALTQTPTKPRPPPSLSPSPSPSLSPPPPPITIPEVTLAVNEENSDTEANEYTKKS